MPAARPPLTGAGRAATIGAMTTSTASLSEYLDIRDGLVSFTGAGGKSAAIDLLAGRASTLPPKGARVLVTSSGMTQDPRFRAGSARRFSGRVLLESRWAIWDAEGPADRAELLAQLESRIALGDPVFLASAENHESRRLRGVPASALAALRALCDLILVECGSARGLPLPAAGPDGAAAPGSDCIVAVVGLEALGRPSGPAVTPDPSRFRKLTGCAPGDTIEPRHIAALAASPEGLFRGRDSKCRAILALNKADLLAAPQAPGAAVPDLAALGRIVLEISSALPPGIEVIACSFAQDRIYAVGR